MALGFSMMTGIYTALGALVPMVVLTPDLIWTRNGALILAGNVITIGGVVVQAVAGDLRDKQSGASEALTLAPKISFGAGLAICIVSGVLSGMLNFSYAFGKPIAETAQHFGATKDNALNALWLVALPAGGVLNVGYCVYLMGKRNSRALLYRDTAPVDWLHAWVMSALGPAL